MQYAKRGNVVRITSGSKEVAVNLTRYRDAEIKKRFLRDEYGNVLGEGGHALFISIFDRNGDAKLLRIDGTHDECFNLRSFLDNHEPSNVVITSHGPKMDFIQYRGTPDERTITIHSASIVEAECHAGGDTICVNFTNRERKPCRVFIACNGPDDANRVMDFIERKVQENDEYQEKKAREAKAQANKENNND
jgi:hypothetical protein